MRKVEIIVTPEQIEILKKESKTSKNTKTKIKSKVLYLRAIGKTEIEIIAKTGLTVATIVSYVRDFNENGMESIYRTKHKGQVSKLNDYSEIIMENFAKKPPLTIDEAIIRIKEITGLTRTYNAVRLFLLKKGLHTRKQEIYHQKQTRNNSKNL